MRRAAVGAALACPAVALLPWARSGEAVRSGYEIVRVARSSGAVPGWLGLLGVAAMAALPVLGGLVAVAAALRRDRLVAILTVVVGLLLGAAVAAVHLAPLGVEAGLWAGAAGAAAAMASGAAAWR